MLAAVGGAFNRRAVRIVVPLFLLVSLLLFVEYSSQRISATIALLPLPNWRTCTEQSPFYCSGDTPYYQQPTRAFFPPAARPPPASSSTHQPATANTTTTTAAAAAYCAGFPTARLDDVQIVLRTGLQETERNRAWLETLGSCIHNLLIFSDVEEQIGHHLAIDALAQLPPSYATEPDFAYYLEQKAAHAAGEPIEKSRKGWKLDRFKFLPMVERSFELRPDAQWFVFLEVDIYYFWDTLFRLLDQLHPERMHYLGSPAPGREKIPFAYGGGGFVISRGLMQRVFGDGRKLSVEYESLIKEDCCGDSVLGFSIWNTTGIRLEALHPTFSGTDLRLLRITEENWCIPLLGLHHVKPERMHLLWEWERTRVYDENPFVHSSLLDFTHRELGKEPVRELWNNFADRALPEGNESPGACHDACLRRMDCFGYSWWNECMYTPDIMMGQPVENKNKTMTSGWDLTKMKKLGYTLKKGKNNGCKKANWVRPKLYPFKNN